MVQVSGCSECPSLLLLMKGSRDSTCVRYEQVYDLLGVVVKLKKEMKRLRDEEIPHSDAASVLSSLSKGRQFKGRGGVETGPRSESRATPIPTCLSSPSAPA